MQRALDVELLGQVGQQQLLEAGAVQSPQFGPQLRLGRFEEDEDAGGEQGEVNRPFGIGAGLSTDLAEHLLDVRLERTFVGVLAHGCFPSTKRTRSRRSSSNGVMKCTPSATHAFGILTVFFEFSGFSCVTTVMSCA